jgi:hypothetical protein
MSRAVPQHTVRPTHINAWCQHLLSAMALSALAACGGGGDNTPSTTTPEPGSAAITLSGTVATGAAVSGTVTAKDANGLVRTGTIAADGSYRIDVSGLQAPFLLRAVGTVGNKQIVLTAPVTAADFNSTINITPLSDLLVANLGGQAADAFFSAPDFSKLDKASVDSALKDLQAKLAPVLEAAGLTNVDFLRVPFAANHTGVDGLLDVLEINVDAATKTATIVSKVTGDSVSDNLQAKGTQDATKITLTEANKALLTQTTRDPAKTQRVAEVQALLDQYNALFATQLPSKTAVKALCSSDFLDPVGDCDAWANQQTDSDRRIGRRAAITRIVAFDEMQPGNIDEAKTASGDVSDTNLGVLVTNDDGGEDHTATLLSKVDGKWKIAGERRKVYISLEGAAYQILSIAADGAQTLNDTGSGLYIGINSSKGEITRAVVTGPGLPDEGVELAGSNNQDLQFTNRGGSLWNQLNNSALTSASLYTVKVYSGDSATPAATYQQYLGTKSVPTVEQTQGKFPALVTPINAAWCAAFGGVLEWTKPAGSVNTQVRASCLNESDSLSSKPVALGSTNKSTLSIPPGFMPEVATQATDSYVKIEVRDADGVNYSTEVTRHFAAPTPTPPVIDPPVAPGSKIDAFGDLAIKSGQEQALPGESLFSAQGDTWYSQVCDATGSLLAVNFDSTAIVSQVTDQNLLKERTFTTVECRAPDRAAVSLKFNADGTATVRDNAPSFTASASEVQALLTSSTPPDEDGFSSAIRVFKAVVNGVENWFLAEKDTGSDGLSFLFFWKEVPVVLD